jgi:hypothetical protein
MFWRLLSRFWRLSPTQVTGRTVCLVGVAQSRYSLQGCNHRFIGLDGISSGIVTLKAVDSECPHAQLN